MPTIALLGTCDTKLSELLYLRSQILLHPSTTVLLIDVGRHPVSHPSITFGPPDLLSHYAKEAEMDMQSLQSLPRNQLVELMSRLCTSHIQSLFSRQTIHGIVSLGGSNATALAAPVMRNALPIGFPKLMVSTVASGDTGPYVGETDITMMYSVVDVAGLNEVLRGVLGNAAGAVVGMANAYYERRRIREGAESGREIGEGREKEEKEKKEKKKARVGITMFGVTTPSVDAIRQYLESKYPGVIETMVFHATGHGGKAMERLVRAGELDAVIDLTTTELADELVGGVMSAGPDRMRAAVGKGIPYIVSLGALDMVNFGPPGTVPERFRSKDANERKLYEHNPTVTLLRTSVEECREIGRRMCERLLDGGDASKIQVWIPKGGLSMLSVAGAPFEDRDADEALFQTVREGLKGSGILVKDDERHVNDKGFAHDVAEAMAKLLGLSNGQQI
ncbi:hypothetical protein GE21DRAFT_1842 [Neurospora crassa]|uniref:Transcriptional regulator n=1 Tax=Neurospora crassa (strain ATCC 24698 / 74-OR23-1A / CBS 708.71 / DSM 1257 / FGSC 987) TaxID=367110 RepID=Q7SFG8_NEUCR|nr:transcriptional regulator [Neurospora crassa OR74A]EAA35543.1 transcriptional regulator [Neurospora crassa OR74A]KHE82183.1 hypothetical protein GE21DRAFT_1842 [Neurospora crassa]|eukprot:XP_964779.1 transcriptional regulator [Neurospora crassa OR74A]